MLPKKRFGVKYTRQPASDHSCSDEGINPYLPPQASKKFSTIKDSNDKNKHGIHFSLDFKLKCKVKASYIHGIPLATDNRIVVRHRLYTPTLNSATFQHSIVNDTATLQHDWETFGSHFRNCRHSSASHSATSDRFRRLYHNLSYATPRIHAERARWQSVEHLLINDTERSPKLSNLQSAICNPSAKHRVVVDGRHYSQYVLAMYG